MPSPSAGQEEIEIDINALDNTTLWKLHNFVESCKATTAETTKAEAAAAAVAAAAVLTTTTERDKCDGSPEEWQQRRQRWQRGC